MSDPKGSTSRKLSRSPSNSAIIRTYTKARQELEIHEQHKRLSFLVAEFHKVSDKIHLRRHHREEHFQKKPEKIEKKAKPKAGAPKEALIIAEKYKHMDEHKISMEDLTTRLKTDIEKGLATQEAVKRNQEYGDNVLTEKKKLPWWLVYAKNLVGLFQCLLWIGAGMSMVAFILNTNDISNLILALALVFIVFLTATVTYLQTAKSESIMEAFKNFIPPLTKVLRDGQLVSLEAAKLVPGDIVEVKGGDRIPADIRITFSQEMKVDNSSLTGESDPLLRTVECTNKENPLETANLAFFGTLCKEGIGRGMVIQIGDSTVIGQIANLAGSAGGGETNLRKELDSFIIKISIVALIIGCLFFGLGFVVGYTLEINLVYAIGVVIANVPEGLLVAVTAALTMAAQKLATKKVLVKNLEAIETLGSTSCICSDKTGTLTQNKMTVQHLWYDDKVRLGESMQKFGKEHTYEYDINSEGFKLLHENAILCSEATFNEAVPDQKLKPLDDIKDQAAKDKKRAEIEAAYKKEFEAMPWQDRPAIGDASETGIIKFFQPIKDIKETRQTHAIRKMKDGSLAKIPFNSRYKYALVIVEYKIPGSVNCILIKGAPERVWALCSHIMVNGEKLEIDEKWQKRFAEVNNQFGSGGERVLGFAKLHLPENQFPEDYQFNCKNPEERNYPMKGFIFSGLISFIDPPRESVPFAILKCKTAGIKVIMVTGDQPITAAAIARQVNIFGKDEKTVNEIAEQEKISLEEALPKANALVIHGDLITLATQHDEALPPDQRGQTILRWLEKPRIVFARTTPAQKLIIVKACKMQGHVVAVTGDGVNDSPAIKEADIGIAMGVTGSDVAKDAADMVLLTDDFAAIVLGIEEGRRIFDNLKKSICYILSSKVPEMMPFIALIIFQLPPPLSAILLLCIDLGTDIVPAIGLGSEEAELGIMTRPPRKKWEHLVTKKLLTASYAIIGIQHVCGGLLAYFTIMYDFGFDISDLFFLVLQRGFFPAPGDIYDPNALFYGQTNSLFIDYCLNCWAGTGTCDPDALPHNLVDSPPDWFYYNNDDVDLRLYYLTCKPGFQYGSRVEWEPCQVKQISSISHYPVCYSTEALKFAQTGFFFGIVLCQITNAINVKGRRESFMHSGLRNYVLLFGIACEIMLTFFLAYVPGVNKVIGARDLYFLHYAWPAVPFCIFELAFQEVRKYLIRTVKPKGDKPNWFERNTMW